MPRIRVRCLRVVAFMLSALAAATASPSFGETLRVTSSPPGANVEIDGVLVGVTPYKIDYPGGYFHKPHTVFAARLGHAMVVRIYKEGYASQETTITEGPFEWTDLKGHSRGRYWLVKADEVRVTLRPLTKTASSDRRAGPIPVKNNDSGIERSPAEASAPHAFSTASVSADTGALILSSEPTGSEIYVDGKFVGDTPATISLASGAHQITIKSTGKKDWSHEIEVMKGSQVTLRAVFDHSP
ncbi:MAG: PEGA domain-containing protein [Candidatus Acidiferrales bacterium]